jgi:CheY-specific phosphatase CheX
MMPLTKPLKWLNNYWNSYKGELVNIVSGRAKTSLSEDSGTLYRLSLPSIIKRPGHEITGRPKNCPFLFLVFEAEGHSFVLQVTFRYF